jgi:CubicO group peptidase (beta-lactamase class C family)
VSARFGDASLAVTVEKALGRRNRAAGVATVAAGRRAVASVNAPLHADYEIGSISKGITGLLYADAIDRGEVTPASTLGDLLPMPEGDAARVSLGSLSTHTSGLPRLPEAAEPLKRSIALWRHGANPYGDTLSELVEQARGVKVQGSKPRYSNFGFELLGHALASAAGMSYPELVRTRLTDPLGMPGSYVPADAEQLRPSAIPGQSRLGRARDAWTGEAIGPAGGIRSTIEDLSLLLAALLDGTAPGMAALEPVTDFGPRVRIGAAWITIGLKGNQVTWHNGGTGGFRSWVGIDRAAGTGVAVVSAASAPTDGFGFRMLQGLNPP